MSFTSPWSEIKIPNPFRCVSEYVKKGMLSPSDERRAYVLAPGYNHTNLDPVPVVRMPGASTRYIVPMSV